MEDTHISVLDQSFSYFEKDGARTHKPVEQETLFGRILRTEARRYEAQVRHYDD